MKFRELALMGILALTACKSTVGQGNSKISSVDVALQETEKPSNTVLEPGEKFKIKVEIKRLRRELGVLRNPDGVDILQLRRHQAADDLCHLFWMKHTDFMRLEHDLMKKPEFDENCADFDDANAFLDCHDRQLELLFTPKEIARYYNSQLMALRSSLKCVNEELENATKLQEMADPTLDLNMENFPENVLKGRAVVYFYDTLCKDCNMEGDFTDLAKRFRGKLKVGRIDIRKETKLYNLLHFSHKMNSVMVFEDGKLKGQFDAGLGRVELFDLILYKFFEGKVGLQSPVK